MTTVTQSYRCAHCHRPLPIDPTRLCPNCGKVGREINVVANKTISITENIRRQTRREYYQKNPKILAVVIGVTVASPFLGLVLVGWVGVVVGLVLGAIAYRIGPWASIKIIEIHHG